MELTILERLTLLQLLPGEGSLTTIRIVRKLRESLSMTEEEIVEHEVVQSPSGQVAWQNDRARPIEFGATAREIAVTALEALDTAGKVEDRHLSLFDKFGIGID